MSNLRQPSIPLSADTIRTVVLESRRCGKTAQAERMQMVMGTPFGAAMLIERFRH